MPSLKSMLITAAIALAAVVIAKKTGIATSLGI